MGLVNTVELLAHADEHSYAVGAFNVISLEFLNGILEAAEEEHSPVILNIAEVHFPYINIEQITPAVKYMADRARVPVVLNLDHGLSVETVVRTLRCGFSAIMYDASKKPFEQNIEETRLVVKMAHAVGVSVEGELGQVGGAEGGKKSARAKREYFTDPAQAERFVAETGIDALAVSVGNVHGFYDGEPELDFELIAEIRRRTGIPLVLHGGSGISDPDFRRAVGCGIRKINFFTEMSKEATDRVRELLAANEDIMIPDFLREAKERVREVVKERLRVFGSSGACALPGNICPTGGNCGSCAECGTTVVLHKITSPAPKAVMPVPSAGNSSFADARDERDEIAEIVRQVVTRILDEGR